MNIQRVIVLILVVAGLSFLLINLLTDWNDYLSLTLALLCTAAANFLNLAMMKKERKDNEN
ncbi:MAG: hypothetical protein Q4C54_03045 [Clostridia bacterium]|nr:hypothetical protein [Clostridia bacterium]